MSEIESLKVGAPDLTNTIDEFEKNIRREVESDFPELSIEQKKAVIKSRLSLIQNSHPTLIKADLGENAGKNSKAELFE